MSGQDPIMYDYQTLQTAFQTVKQFGQQVNKLGTALTNVHNELEEHCSGDESGVGAVIAGAAKDVTGVAGKVFTEGGRVLAEMGTRGKTNGERTQNTDQTIADTLNKINDGLNGGGTSGSSNGEGDRGITQTGGGTGTGTGSQTGTGATTGVGEDGGSGGQSAEGNDECTQDGEPVDVVSGQLLTSAADVQLPGTLALVLRRAYASGYQGGRLFGPGWSSTLDQRVEVDDDGIHFYGDDAQILHYAVPTLPGQRVLPAAGEHWLLTWDRASDTIRVHDPRSGWTREFAGGAARKADRHDTRPIKAITDRHGNRIEFHHDRDGLPSEVRHTGGYRVAVDTVHTADGFRIEALRLLGRDSAMPGTKLIDYGYDPYGRLTALTDSSDVPFIYEYDAADRISAWIDRNGYRYEYSYDQTGRVLTGHGEDGYLSATFAYDLEKRVTTVTDSTGRKTRYHYDAHRHVVAIEDPLGRHSTNTLDQHGRLLARTDALGGTTRFELTESGDPRRIERPDGTVVTIDYDERGNPTRVVRPDASVWQYTYDATGNLLTVTDPLGATFSRTYDDRGTLTSVADPFGRSYQYETDAAGLVTGVIDPAGVHVASITRDAFGRVATHADAMGGLTRNGWTTEGLPTWREYPDGSRETWEHDPEGNLASHVAPSGAVTHYTAGPFGIVLTRRGGDSGLLAFEYDTELRLTAVVNALGQRWSYEFDAVGNVSAETDFCGRTVRYRSDATGRLVHRVNGAGQAVWFERDLMGRVVRRVSEDSSVEFGYDSVGRITRAIADDWVLDYVRDPMGRVVAESSDGRHTAYTYDKAGRLTSRTTPSGITSTWTYDAAGHASGLRALEHSITFDYDVAGRETTRHLGDHAALTQSWDAAHRLTGQSLWKFNGAHEAPGEAGYTALQQRTYAYRAGGQLTAVHDLLRGSRTYELDAAGRVTTVNAAAWTERYVYDEVGNLSSADRPHSGGSPEVTGAPGVVGSIKAAARPARDMSIMTTTAKDVSRAYCAAPCRGSAENGAWVGMRRTGLPRCTDPTAGGSTGTTRWVGEPPRCGSWKTAPALSNTLISAGTEHAWPNNPSPPAPTTAQLHRPGTTNPADTRRSPNTRQPSTPRGRRSTGGSTRSSPTWSALHRNSSMPMGRSPGLSRPIFGARSCPDPRPRSTVRSARPASTTMRRRTGTTTTSATTLQSPAGTPQPIRSASPPRRTRTHTSTTPSPLSILSASHANARTARRRLTCAKPQVSRQEARTCRRSTANGCAAVKATAAASRVRSRTSCAARTSPASTTSARVSGPQSATTPISPGSSPRQTNPT